MHDERCEGNDYFKCDFCLQSWSEDRPMIEGHKGSLVCCKCLTAAYADVVYAGQGVMGVAGPLKEMMGQGPGCTMCLERRAELYWQSPVVDDALICRRCLRQAVTALESDPDFGYTRPPAPAGMSPPVEEIDADDDDAD
ncbi:MAG: hypothetical protein K2X32_10315 [Phycisphaerales bacterium]|nr:hypothetical protein [Phycisphaerales bacterium]